MTREELKQYIKDNCEPEFLDRAKRKGYVCPACGNGSGQDGDGIVGMRTDRGMYYKCFKCALGGDVFDLIGVYYGLEDDKAKFEKAYEYFNLQPDQQQEGCTRRRTHTRPAAEPAAAPEEGTDYTEFYLQAEKNNDFSYLQKRGISKEVQQRFHVGFVPDWKHSKKYPENVIGTPRCIIPRSRYSYLARFTGSMEELARYDERMNEPKLNSSGQITLFNLDALKESKIVFIVEGEIDAMSICEAGGDACGLCSVGNRLKLLDYLKDHKTPGQVFVIMMDNDEAGEKGTSALEKGLQGLGLPFVCAAYPEGIKDPNEYLQKDREGFKEWVSSLQVKALEAGNAAPAEAAPDNTGNQYKAADLLDYFRNIEERPDTFEAKTGFSELDRLLFGGLHEGLYIIGAISSLGKTTFTLQIADQIAEQGQDVLFFSLEMSKYELIAKSLSRLTYNRHRYAKTEEGRYIARDTSQILNNRRYAAYSPQERKAIQEAIKDYEQAAQHLFIYEGRYEGERLKVSDIRSIVKKHIEERKAAPVVFVDYLQIIAKEKDAASGREKNQSDKQATDEAVFELKEISRDYQIPVFAISSFNRDNYNEPVTMASFKESGAIEYSSDVLFGLQYAGMGYEQGDTDKKRKERLRDLIADVHRRKRDKEPIDIELKCLKTRNGYQFSTAFRMMPAFNHFEEYDHGAADFVKTYEKTPFDKDEKVKRG